MFTSAKYNRCIFFCCLAAAFNQLSGVNAIAFFSTGIFDSIGLDPVTGGYLIYAGALSGAGMGVLA